MVSNWTANGGNRVEDGGFLIFSEGMKSSKNWASKGR